MTMKTGKGARTKLSVKIPLRGPKSRRVPFPLGQSQFLTKPSAHNNKISCVCIILLNVSILVWKFYQLLNLLSIKCGAYRKNWISMATGDTTMVKIEH